MLSVMNERGPYSLWHISRISAVEGTGEFKEEQKRYQKH